MFIMYVCVHVLYDDVYVCLRLCMYVIHVYLCLCMLYLECICCMSILMSMYVCTFRSMNVYVYVYQRNIDKEQEDTVITVFQETVWQ